MRVPDVYDLYHSTQIYKTESWLFWLSYFWRSISEDYVKNGWRESVIETIYYKSKYDKTGMTLSESHPVFVITMFDMSLQPH